MLEQNTSPVPESAGPHNGVHFRDDSDIELPASDESLSSDALGSNQVPEKLPGWLKLLGGAVLTAGILIGGLGLLPGGSDESQHPNWQHVTAATDASKAGMSQLVHLSAAGTTETVKSVEVTSVDADRTLTWEIRQALLRGDLGGATRTLQAAQRIPASPDGDVQLPDLAADADLVRALKDGRKELFQIELFDCCHEDGDVVEVLVNGSHFATIPIMNAGTLLSIPLGSGNNAITVRGTRDGGGGVTLSFRTSRGDFFARHLRVGEAYQLGVVVQ